MLTVYAVPISLYCAKLRIVLRHKGLKWNELQPPGGYGSVDYKKVVASGNLPALVDGDLLLADSEAIAEYVDEKFPVPNMLPDSLELRAKARQLGRFHDTRLEPEIRKLFGIFSCDKQDTEFKYLQAKQINERLSQLSYLYDNSPTKLFFTHCGYPISFAWLDLLNSELSLQLNWPDEIVRWRHEIESFPAVALELSDYVPKLDEWVKKL